MRVATATRWLHSRLETVSGSPTVTYRRGGESIVGLSAVPANTQHGALGEDPATYTTRERDWMVWVSDLELSGTRWVPKRGDAIDWTDENGTLRTFNVLPRVGDRCFRHTDQTMQQYRVYTVEGTPNAE